MLADLIAGTRDSAVLADLARGRLRAKIPALTQALTGRFGPTHVVVVGEILAHMDYPEEAIARVSARIAEVIAPFALERDLLTTIPGIDVRLDEAIIGEIGVDIRPLRHRRTAGLVGRDVPGPARVGRQVPLRTLTPRGQLAATTPDGGRDGRRPHQEHLPRRPVLPAGRAPRQGPSPQAVGHSLLVAISHVMGRTCVHLDAGYDSPLSRALLPERGLTGQIAREGLPAPTQATKRWPVERIHAWHNTFYRLARCTERRQVVADFYIALANAVILVRCLIRTAWTTYRWDTRPRRRP